MYYIFLFAKNLWKGTIATCCMLHVAILAYFL